MDADELSFSLESSKEMLVHGLSKMHKKLALLDILEIVSQSYEAEILCFLTEENMWDSRSTT